MSFMVSRQMTSLACLEKAVFLVFSLLPFAEPPRSSRVSRSRVPSICSGTACWSVERRFARPLGWDGCVELRDASVRPSSALARSAAVMTSLVLVDACKGGRALWASAGSTRAGRSSSVTRLESATPKCAVFTMWMSMAWNSPWSCQPPALIYAACTHNAIECIEHTPPPSSSWGRGTTYACLRSRTCTRADWQS
jgi:hypothetical protein